jgi:hypothetical protein
MIFIDNKYTRIYYSIIDRAKSRTLPLDTYTEKHHIIPKSLNGSDSSENLVILTAREHFICHWLLTKMTVTDSQQKMIFAFVLMLKCKTKTQKRYNNKITSRLYEKYKTLSSNIKKDLYKGKARNKTLYKFCHVDGRIEICSILEMSLKHNLLRSSLGHLVKKPEGKHHVKGWCLNFPLKSSNRSDLYTGEGSPTYDNTIYTFVHKSKIVEKCTKYELFTKYNLPRNGIYSLCSNKQKSSHGWSLIKD